jgi:hypothetical protein
MDDTRACGGGGRTRRWGGTPGNHRQPEACLCVEGLTSAGRAAGQRRGATSPPPQHVSAGRLKPSGTHLQVGVGQQAALVDLGQQEQVLGRLGGQTQQAGNRRVQLAAGTGEPEGGGC